MPANGRWDLKGSCLTSYCLLRNAQRCCHHLVGKVTNNVQETLSAPEHFHEDRIKLEKHKDRDRLRDKISPKL